MAIVAEPAAAHCTYGRSKVTVGPDSNTNNRLDSGEVATTTYACNGAPGPGVTWYSALVELVAKSNTGYLAGSASRVTVTLPASPSVGDVIRVSGVGGSARSTC